MRLLARPLIFAVLFLVAGIVHAEDPLDARVTVRVRDVPLGVYLATIASQSGVDFVLSDDVAYKHVTASLGRVTVREALDILSWQGMGYYPLPKRGRYLIARQ